MTERTETIPEYLARMAVRDQAKGGDGYRTSRQVADYFGLTTTQARRKLDRLYEDDEIDCCQDGAIYYWFAAPIPSSNEQET